LLKLLTARYSFSENPLAIAEIPDRRCKAFANTPAVFAGRVIRIASISSKGRREVENEMNKNYKQRGQEPDDKATTRIRWPMRSLCWGL